MFYRLMITKDGHTAVGDDESDAIALIDDMRDGDYDVRRRVLTLFEKGSPEHIYPSDYVHENDRLIKEMQSVGE